MTFYFKINATVKREKKKSYAQMIAGKPGGHIWSIPEERESCSSSNKGRQTTKKKTVQPKKCTQITPFQWERVKTYHEYWKLRHIHKLLIIMSDGR